MAEHPHDPVVNDPADASAADPSTADASAADPSTADASTADASAADADTTEAVEQVMDAVRARGGRATRARRLLLTELFAHDQGSGHHHHSAEELAASVQASAPDVHVSTIYRNLEELERLGVVEHSHLGHGPATYHLTPVQHSHLVCSECGGMTEVSTDLLEDAARRASQEHGFTINPHHFALLGVCKDCS